MDMPVKGETETASDRCGGFFGQECSARVPFPDTQCTVYTIHSVSRVVTPKGNQSLTSWWFQPI